MFSGPGLKLLGASGTFPKLRELERIRTMIELQVAHMVRLIDDLLDVSRITSGKIEVSR